MAEFAKVSVRFGRFCAGLAFGCMVAGAVYAADMKTEKGQLAPFDEVSIQIPGNVDLQSGAEFGYSISAETHVIRAIVFKVRGKRLSVEATQEFETKRPVQITLHLPSLARLQLLGSADVKSRAKTDTQAIHVILDGASSLDMQSVQTRKVLLQNKGSGSVMMAGKADRLDVELSGSGDLNLKNLQSMDAAVSIAGSGEVTVSASKTLDASISGAGEISYTGNPSVRQKISGAGDISKVK